MLLLNRKKAVEQNLSDFSWNTGMKAMRWTLKKRRNLDFVNGNLKNKLAKLNPAILGKEKEFPQFAKHSFSETWKINLNK